MSADEADEVERFWTQAKEHLRMNPAPGYFGSSPLEVVMPPAWSFGSSAEQADELVRLVLEGTKTATASALRDYEAGDEPLPEPGTLGIVLDGAGRPRAVLVTTEVRVVPFGRVDEAHAYDEGEGDRSLASWREAHRRFFAETDVEGRPVTDDTAVVLERFEVAYPS